MTKYLIFTLFFFGCSERLHDLDDFEVINTKTEDEIIATINEQDLKLYKDKSAIPTSVKRQIKKWGEKFEIVNPRQKYQVTDIYNGKPTRQLISIFKNKNHFIMTYNHGGHGHHRHIVYFQLDNNQITGFWVGPGGGRNGEIDSKEKLIDLLTKIKARPVTEFVEL